MRKIGITWDGAGIICLSDLAVRPWRWYICVDLAYWNLAVGAKRELYSGLVSK